MAHAILRIDRAYTYILVLFRCKLVEYAVGPLPLYPFTSEPSAKSPTEWQTD